MWAVSFELHVDHGYGVLSDLTQVVDQCLTNCLSYLAVLLIVNYKLNDS
jgi:hypothetical protein